MAKLRLDKLLIARGMFTSRERAREAIINGEVFVGGKAETKAGAQVDDAAEIEFRGRELPFVSRGGLKLEKAIAVFDIDLNGVRAADIGASTGGFTDCMLRAGASKVYAIDVGSDQLAESLRADERVVNMERTNVRDLKPSDIGEALDFASIDVSFISLGLVLKPVRAILKDGGAAVALVKPQFEAGRENVGKKGVVRDPTLHLMVLEKFVENANSAGFGVKSLDYSPVRGPEGNIEYLAHLIVGGQNGEFDLKELVFRSHEELSEGNR